MNNRLTGVLIALFLCLISASGRSEVEITICYNRANGECPETPGALPGDPTESGKVELGRKVDTLGLCSNETGTWKCGNLPMSSANGGYLTSSAPNGWTGGVNNPPSQGAAPATMFGGCGCQANTTDASACAMGKHKSMSAGCGSSQTSTCNPNGPNNSFSCYSTGYPATAQTVVVGAGTLTCASGYGLSGGNCVLNEATNGLAKWPGNGKCEPQRVGDTWVQGARDPDCGTPGGTFSVLPSGFVPSGNNKVVGTGSNGSSSTAGLGATDGGGAGRSKVVNTDPNSDGKTSTVGTVGISEPKADGKPVVDGYGEEDKNGVGTGTGTGGGGGGTSFDKSGLATEGTQAGILDAVGGIKNAITGTHEGGGFSHVGTPGHDPVNKANEITAARAAIAAQVATIKAEASALFSGALAPGAYSCGSPVAIHALNINVGFCLADYQSQFVMIGNGLIFLAYGLALFIILSK